MTSRPKMNSSTKFVFHLFLLVYAENEIFYKILLNKTSFLYFGKRILVQVILEVYKKCKKNLVDNYQKILKVRHNYLGLSHIGCKRGLWLPKKFYLSYILVFWDKISPYTLFDMV